jgi:chromosome partitioning protein
LELIRQIPDLELLDITIGRRKAFSNATGTGRAVTEYPQKDPKAIEELRQLMESLYAN